ncbi:MAG: hypothetical protein P8J70_03090 [Glaciecola sp.]|nr:hypothetical protein [Glaciecola sp.]MDG1816270.1 hypothetical protein [Glaciecola sp.]MDG2098652.1 hypothetical protein [Glaciecola sp.]
MTTTTKTLMLISLILLACVCYFIGTLKGAIAFIALGIILEIGFWVGLFSKKKSS